MSAPLRGRAHQEIVEILDVDTIWPYKRWAVRALAPWKEGRGVRYPIVRGRGPTTRSRRDVRGDPPFVGARREAYSRYGLRANRRGTYLATFRAVAKKYPHKDAHELLPTSRDDAGRGGEMVRRSQGSRSLR